MTRPATLPAGATDDGESPPHPAWLPAEAFRALGTRRVLVHGDGPLVDTVFAEVARACAATADGRTDWHGCDLG